LPEPAAMDGLQNSARRCLDFDAGHGIGSTRAQQDSEAADTYAFLLWQTGGRTVAI